MASRSSSTARARRSAARGCATTRRAARSSPAYLAPDPDYGGCYIISAYWKPTDDTSVNEWGYSTRNRLLNEAVKLRAMAQSFVVSGNAGSMVSTFQNDLDLATEGRAAWLYLVENGRARRQL